MSVSMDTNSLAQQLKDVAVSAVTTVKEAVVGQPGVDDKHRVFVGNLATETTEDEVKTLFSQAGEIVSVSLPSRRNQRTRSNMPSAIAFVSYTSDADAQKAVETLNGKSLGERELTVAIARPLTQRTAKPQTNGDHAEQNAADGATTSNGHTAATNGEKKKQRKPRKPKTASAEPTTGDAASASAPQTNGAASQTNGTASTKPRSSRPPREKGPPSNGIPSDKTLFVAGIEPSTTDAELKELFAQYKAASAHVALRPIPRFMVKKLAEKGEQRLNRGFGFVSFADHDSQQAALQGMNGHKLGEKELAVKVAIDAPERAATASPAAAA